jgi:hypothetical protein
MIKETKCPQYLWRVPAFLLSPLFSDCVWAFSLSQAIFLLSLSSSAVTVTAAETAVAAAVARTIHYPPLERIVGLFLVRVIEGFSAGCFDLAFVVSVLVLIWWGMRVSGEVNEL